MFGKKRPSEREIELEIENTVLTKTLELEKAKAVFEARTEQLNKYISSCVITNQQFVEILIKMGLTKKSK